MKKVLSLGLALCLALMLAACGSSKESAQSALESALTAVKNMDTAAMETYFGEDVLNDNGEDVNAGANAVDDNQKLLLKNLTFKVTSCQESDGKAEAVVDITNVDMAQVLSDFMQQAISETLSYAFLPEDEQPSDEELQKKFSDLLASLLDADDLEMVTNTVNLSMTYADSQWKIAPTNELVDALLGGAVSSLESLGMMSTPE